MIICSVIEESRRETNEDFERRYNHSFEAEWERTKRRIFDQLGQHQPATTAPGKSSTASKSSTLVCVCGRENVSSTELLSRSYHNRSLQADLPSSVLLARVVFKCTVK